MRALLRCQTCVLVLLLYMAVGTVAQATSFTNFDTQEYRNSTGLWVINAGEAYAKGYTGKGITLGILDDGTNEKHFEFQNKAFTWLPAKGWLHDWEKNSHGSHVAGIMVANKDGMPRVGNMHGVAYDADLHAMGMIFGSGEYENMIPDLLESVLARPEVKIINNSWGDNYYPIDVHMDASNESEKLENLEQINSVIAKWMLDLRLPELKAADKLMVFAAGNSGHRSPSIPTVLPTFLPWLDNWLSVVALDSTAGRIRLDENGTKVLKASAVAIFSELAAGAEEYTLAAPGVQINSVAAAGGYVNDSGTSMATPYVSGALGLVQQAYPWMTARQLADTVLTTADKNFHVPGAVVSVSKDILDPDDDESPLQSTIRLQIVDSADRYWDRNQSSLSMPAPGSPDRSRLEAYLHSYYAENEASIRAYYGLPTVDSFISAFFATEDAPYEVYLPDGTLYSLMHGAISSVPFDQIFGQGILDVGKAVDGPAQFNANRMSPADLADASVHAYTGGRQELLYPVNTMGYSGSWNNDISQELWHPQRHQYILPDFLAENPDYLSTMARQTAVGLLKDGEGTLRLTGTNSYQGSTVIRGGSLAISKRADHSGGQLTASDVFVLPQGQLSGNGVISQSVSNWGTVQPGNSIGTLTVGSYTQQPSGTLLVEVDAQGNADSLIVTGNAVLNGTLALAPVAGYYNTSFSVPFPVQTAGTLTGTYTSGLRLNSPTLTMHFEHQVNGASQVSTFRAADAYSRYANNGNAARVGHSLSVATGVQGDMQNLFAALDFSAPDGSEVRTGLSQLAPEAYANAALANFDMHRMLSDLLMPGLLLRSPAPADGGWHVFVQPYGGYVDQPRSGGRGYSASNAGLLSAAERATSSALTIGAHMAFNYQNMTGDENGKLRGEGLYLGAQAKYAPAKWNGWSVFSMGRLGVENWEMKRGVSFSTYGRTNKADWTGTSGSLLLGGSYGANFAMLTVEPFAALDYAFSARPSLTEKNGMGSSLHLNSELSQSLRTRLGVRLATLERPLNEHSTWQGHFSAAWNHELLDKSGTFRASFVNAANASFAQRVSFPSRDSLGLGAGLTFTTSNNVSFALNAGSELFRNNGASVYGNLKVGWKF